jgi:hypothetical protein
MEQSQDSGSGARECDQRDHGRSNDHKHEHETTVAVVMGVWSWSGVQRCLAVQLDNDDVAPLQSVEGAQARRPYAASCSGEASLRPMTDAVPFASIAAMPAPSWLPVNGRNDNGGR